MLREAMGIVTTTLAFVLVMVATRVLDATRGNVRQSPGAPGIRKAPFAVERRVGGSC